MNRGVFQSSPVQQMMAAGNPNWWAIATTRPPSDHQTNPASLPTHHHNNTNFFPHLPFSSPSSNWPHNCSSISDNQDHQITPDSWSQQLFMNGIVGEEAAAMEQLVKQENFNPFVYKTNELFQEAAKSNNNNNNFLWSPHHNTTTTAAAATAAAATSPQSCVTTATKSDHQLKSECNSHAVNNGAAVKKAKVQNSAPESTFKVRKFGDRITTLHQLVSPFGKTDTASVLLEAIGYIRFLQSQIEALSLPYLSNGTENNKRQQHAQSVQGERNCMFPEDSGQVLNDNCLKRKRGPHQEEAKMELRSRGLCLVPVSCTMNVGRDNGADYWAPTLGGFH